MKVPACGGLLAGGPKRALVLAGGGVAGIAWETGVLRGIADAAPDTAHALLNADVLVGTSAGSAVAAQIGSGVGLDALYDRQVADESAELDPGVAIETIGAQFLAALGGPAGTEQKLQRIGAIALAADTVAPPVRRNVIAQRLPSHDWPERVLRLTAIDIDTGELVVLNSTSGADLVDAVAASCAVPGAWPPVTIGGRRYMDGGMGSSVNLSVAADCDSAVVLIPAAEDAPSLLGAGASAEVAAFCGRALAVYADDAARAAFGADPLNPACRVPSATTGRDPGRAVAAVVTEFLGG